MLARFTGKTQQQEARPATTSFNLVRQMRITRYKYLGFILREGSKQPTSRRTKPSDLQGGYSAVRERHGRQSADGRPGTLLLQQPYRTSKG